MNKKNICLGVLALSLIVLSGCRGWRTEKEPFHPNPNMDWQPKYKAQALTAEVPAGTVAWGIGTVYEENETRGMMLGQGELYTGINSDGEYVQEFPVKVNDELLENGQEHYNIYCAVCHDKTGKGHGMVVQRGFVQPPDITSQHISEIPNGALFEIITRGVRTMPAYGKQIQPKDRWAIVAYLKALQYMDNASIKDVPANQRNTLR